jgi:hypothetical protein
MEEGKINEMIDLINTLLPLPEEIQNAQLEILELSKAAKTTTDLINEIEYLLKSEINAATDQAGKKLYTNQELREAALIEKSADEPTLIVNKKDLMGIENTIQKEKIKIEKLTNEQRNIRSILDFFGNVGKSENPKDRFSTGAR